MITFWFKFDFKNSAVEPYGTRIGCGVTAIDYKDAIEILKNKVFKGEPLAEIIFLKRM